MKKFKNMDDARKYIETTLGITELQYSSGGYSYGQKGNIRLIADYNNRSIEVKSEVWEPEKSEETEMVETDNSKIAKLAFFKLYQDKKKDAALRLANCIFSHDSITLSIGDIDWEIEIALNYCGAHPSVGRRYMASFNFKGKTKLPEGHYESLMREFYD